MKNHVALIIKKGDKILFIKRSKFKKNLPNIWAFPTGTVEEDETFGKTARREAWEELAIKIKVERILTTKDLSEFDDRLIFLVCSLKSGEAKIQEPQEIGEIKWQSMEDFFKKNDDTKIGHGLVFLRKNPSLWQSI